VCQHTDYVKAAKAKSECIERVKPQEPDTHERPQGHCTVDQSLIIGPRYDDATHQEEEIDGQIALTEEVWKSYESDCWKEISLNVEQHNSERACAPGCVQHRQVIVSRTVYHVTLCSDG
jgi:hypothetical protein